MGMTGQPDDPGFPRLVCEICGREIRLTGPGVLMFVSCWVETRGSGAAGGNHGFTDVTQLGRYRHKACQAHGQGESLFDSLGDL